MALQGEGGRGLDGNLVEYVPTSLHQRVTDDLLARISSGDIRPGAMLPTEMALCEQYGVSRITIRRALSTLVERRLLVRRRGVGTFATGRSPQPREFHLIGFLDDRRVVSSDIVLNVAERADEAVAAALGVTVGSPVRHIRSLTHRDDKQFTLVDAYTVDCPGESGDERDYRTAAPSANALGERLGRRIERAEQDLEAEAADSIAAGLLRIAPGTPVVRARRTYFSGGDKPVQYIVIRYHPERYRFVVDLVPRSGVAAFAKPPPDPAWERDPPKRDAHIIDNR
jgi:GntR family transcriptional regulator